MVGGAGGRLQRDDSREKSTTNQHTTNTVLYGRRSCAHTQHAAAHSCTYVCNMVLLCCAIAVANRRYACACWCMHACMHACMHGRMQRVSMHACESMGIACAAGTAVQHGHDLSCTCARCLLGVEGGRKCCQILLLACGVARSGRFARGIGGGCGLDVLPGRAVELQDVVAVCCTLVHGQRPTPAVGPPGAAQPRQASLGVCLARSLCPAQELSGAILVVQQVFGPWEEVPMMCGVGRVVAGPRAAPAAGHLSAAAPA